MTVGKVVPQELNIFSMCTSKPGKVRQWRSRQCRQSRVERSIFPSMLISLMSIIVMEEHQLIPDWKINAYLDPPPLQYWTSLQGSNKAKKIPHLSNIRLLCIILGFLLTNSILP